MLWGVAVGVWVFTVWRPGLPAHPGHQSGCEDCSRSPELCCRHCVCEQKVPVCGGVLTVVVRGAGPAASSVSQTDVLWRVLWKLHLASVSLGSLHLVQEGRPWGSGGVACALHSAPERLDLALLWPHCALGPTQSTWSPVPGLGTSGQDVGVARMPLDTVVGLYPPAGRTPWRFGSAPPPRLIAHPHLLGPEAGPLQGLRATNRLQGSRAFPSPESDSPYPP